MDLNDNLEIDNLEADKYSCEKEKQAHKIGTDFSFKHQVVWKNAIGFLILHLLGVYGLYMLYYAKPLTHLYVFLVFMCSSEGITIGAHRFYTHRSFKATLPLRVILVMFQTMAGQNCLWVWARDHRQHHKYSDTDADPHNATRGFFFSHIGWLMSKKHPEVFAKGKGIDMSDLDADPLVMFQKRYYKTLYVIFAILIPSAIPIYFWNEDPLVSFATAYLFRNAIQLNITWAVNSAAHLYGTKPFDKNILPVESIAPVAFITGGEGWHNYHHTFPWDYNAAEYGSKYNITGHIIGFLSYLNLAYDLKTASDHLIKSRSRRTGDGTHPVYGNGGISKTGNTDELEEKINQENVKINNMASVINRKSAKA